MRILAAIACAFMLICSSVSPSHADKRVALVIGNGAYAKVPQLSAELLAAAQGEVFRIILPLVSLRQIALGVPIG
jgi:hypothetical protein